MSDIEKEDPLTRLNTQLNKSMVLMDNVTESVEPSSKSNRSIKINTTAQPAKVANKRSSGSRRSILKKTKKTDTSINIESENGKVHISSDETNITENSRLSRSLKKLPRPQNLEDLMREESLIIEPMDSTFTIDDISDNEDVWVMDVPRTIDPKKLRGQTLTFGDKSKFKIDEEKYSAINHDSKCRITCVFSTGQVKPQYKTVNVRPAGTIAIRRKLLNIRKVAAACTEDTSVPFPENLKMRHPLFGVSYDSKIIKGRKRHSCIGKRKT